MKRTPALGLLCYALIVLAWAVDLITPQLFVAAILLNGPIALSGLALNTRLTVSLIVLAEVANVVSGYVNGVQAGNHWDSIAIGDRVLSAASFLLVGFLTIRAQESARDAGRAMERAGAVLREKTLRRSIEAIRSTLNVELVMRSIVRESVALFGAQQAELIVRSSSLQVPDHYVAVRGDPDVIVERRALDSVLASLVQRAEDGEGVVAVDATDPVARMALDARGFATLLIARITVSEGDVILMLFSDAFARNVEDMLQTFADAASTALAQAWLFAQLGLRNEEVASQRDALERRNDVIRDIVYALAHDLRTPLAAQNVTMGQALDGAYGELPERYREILRTTLASNADLRRLVETLLLVARYESGETSTLREEIAIGDQVARVVDELLPIADVKGARLSSHGDTAARTVGDPSELRRAVTNLVANAIEAAPAGTHVDIRYGTEDGAAFIRIRDEGYGIEPAQRDRLFQRFSEGERRFAGGTGLGLYIVRLIAEKMGGSVRYLPNDSRGSTFELRLPLAIGDGR